MKSTYLTHYSALKYQLDDHFLHVDADTKIEKSTSQASQSN